MKHPRLLDLFCCAGGAAMGYRRAGFEVVGVDIVPQPRYPFAFEQADVLTLDPMWIRTFDAVHASPPCQAYSDLAARNGNADQWPRLIEPISSAPRRHRATVHHRERRGSAPSGTTLCCAERCSTGYECCDTGCSKPTSPVVAPPHRPHPKVHTLDKRKSHYGKTDEWKDYVQVTGGGNSSVAAASDAMGIDWMIKKELNEAIPPAYTEFIGRHLLQHLSRKDAA